jgi:hypothetical protein
VALFFCDFIGVFIMEHDHCSAEARFKGLLPEQTEVLLKYDRDNSLKGLAEGTCFNKTDTMKLFSRQLKNHIIKLPRKISKFTSHLLVKK